MVPFNWSILFALGMFDPSLTNCLLLLNVRNPPSWRVPLALLFVSLGHLFSSNTSPVVHGSTVFRACDEVHGVTGLTVFASAARVAET